VAVKVTGKDDGEPWEPRADKRPTHRPTPPPSKKRDRPQTLGLRIKGLRIKGLKIKGLRIKGLRIKGLKIKGLKIKGLRVRDCTLQC